MKKILALLLCAVMLFSVLAACSKEEEKNPDDNKDPVTNPDDNKDPVTNPDDNKDPDPDPAPAPTMADPEEITYTPVVYYGFEDDSNVRQVLEQTRNANDKVTGVVESSHGIMLADAGVKGKALYLDGNYGLLMNEVPALQDDTYTISFWVYAERSSDYGPTVQLGYNIDGDDTQETVKWINFTQGPWGADAAKLFPLAWNRNSAENTWPWIGVFDDTAHKKEWMHVTLVSTGEELTLATDGTKYLNAQFYFNGVLLTEGKNIAEWACGLSRHILDEGPIDVFMGVNYWDYCLKGYLDEFYMYDEALTPGQVATLYKDGDPSVVPAPPADAPVVPDVPEPEPLGTAPVDPNAIDTVGVPERTTAWWTDWGNAYELPDGSSKTITMNVYGQGEVGGNWNNLSLGFANKQITGHSDPNTQGIEGYAEQAVIRADLFGWTPSTNPIVPTESTGSWGDDWNAFKIALGDADVTVTITRNGAELALDYVIKAADGTELTARYVCTADIAEGDACWFFPIVDGSYIEVLSVA